MAPTQLFSGIPGNKPLNVAARLLERSFPLGGTGFSVVVQNRCVCTPAYTVPEVRTHQLPRVCFSLRRVQFRAAMESIEPSPELPSTSLVGCIHVIGALELRRLLLEGAILVFDHAAPDDIPTLLHQYVVLEATDGDALIQELLPQHDEFLVCLRQDWSPAVNLAERLSSHGYQLVFTADSQAASVFASDVSGVLDQP